MSAHTHTMPTDVLSFETFGDMLKYLRRRVRLTQNQLAGAVGYTREHLARLETNARPPDLAVVKALFIDALELQHEPNLTAQLLALAQAAHFVAVATPLPTIGLPIALTSFVGRQHDTSEIVKLLERARLVTLTGTGGVGKTRLALHLAVSLHPQFADGVSFVELAPVQDMAFVPNVVATALKLPATKLATKSLIAHLAEKQHLLILDNCEHVLTACATLAETLLKACPQLKILATSRAAFGILGATVYRVPSLSLPSPSMYPHDIHLIAQAEAVQLFLARVIDLKPEFGLTERNAVAVCKLCQRLDGIPLAIELAASQMRVMPIEQILARLEQRFEFAAVGHSNNLPRHQTLQAVMDWSYALLNSAEQQLFRRLSVFVGGWTLDAIEHFQTHMAEKTSNPDTVSDTLQLFIALLDKSLIVLDERDHETRYGMLESVRDYALSKLHQSNEIAAARLAHLQFYLNLTAQADPQLRRTSQRSWYRRLEAEHDNVRAALNWAIGIRNITAAATLIANIWFFWFWRGYWGEGALFTRHVLAMTTPLEKMVALTDDCPKVLLAALIFASRTGNNALFNTLLPLIHQWVSHLHDSYYLAWAQIGFSFATPDPEQAIHWLEAAHANAQLANDDWLRGEILFIQGDRERARGQYANAAKHYQDSIAILKTIDDDSLMAYPIGNLGRLALVDDNTQQARLYFEEAIALCRADSNRNGIADWLLQLATLNVRCGDTDAARFALNEVIRQFHEIGNLAGVADTLVQYAALALQNTRDMPSLVFAATVLGAADRIFETHNRLHQVVELVGDAEFKQRVLVVKLALSDAMFAAAWAKGRVMTTTQVIAFATQH
ncbi:MAG: helix-turn-helix domain-containing protein [Anaerolineae bacterium]|nr:helix-turn-helix domain-containing protein [Anaerolineae bacterium]